MKVLQLESELEEIVRLVGIDALSSDDRLTMETAKSIREDYLHQNAFHDVDTYTSLDKQYRLLKLVLEFNSLGKRAIKEGAKPDDVFSIEARDAIGRAKYVEEDKISESFKKIEESLKKQIDEVIAKGGEENA
jgi:V/A-type H+-transporting ATPase subunit A